MRKKMVAGNWKMNKTPSEAIELVKELKPLVADSDVDVVFCVPSIDIMPVKNELEGSNIYIGAENMFYEEKGAYTGELSADMLTDAGVTHVILGHSERRQYFNEDDSMINRKVSAAIGHGIVPIICCGESFEQRERGITLQVIKKQIVGAFMRISAEDAAKCIIAYEPIQEVCNVIRNNIRDIYGKQVAETVRILYGGSVNADNALALFSEPDIDGGLVGGASLRPEFAKIVNYNK